MPLIPRAAAAAWARWLPSALAFVAIALAVHLALIWAAPRLIMAIVLGQAAPLPGANFPPPIDHTQRRIVLPSPDLLYATCVYDLSRGPLRVHAEPGRAGALAYWSIALYAANTDNVFVLNDREAGDAPVDLLVLPQEGDAVRAAPPGSRIVRVPGGRGLLLMRVLVPDRERDRPVAERARRTLRCESA